MEFFYATTRQDRTVRTESENQKAIKMFFISAGRVQSVNYCKKMQYASQENSLCSSFETDRKTFSTLIPIWYIEICHN